MSCVSVATTLRLDSFLLCRVSLSLWRDYRPSRCVVCLCRYDNALLAVSCIYCRYEASKIAVLLAVSYVCILRLCHCLSLASTSHCVVCLCRNDASLRLPSFSLYPVSLSLCRLACCILWVSLAILIASSSFLPCVVCFVCSSTPFLPSPRLHFAYLALSFVLLAIPPPSLGRVYLLQ